MADDRGIEEQLGVIAGNGIEAGATLDPVVALIAHQEVDVGAAQDEVVALAAEHFGSIYADEDGVLAVATHDDVAQAVRGRNDIIAFVAFDKVFGITLVGDDVVAGATHYQIDALPTFDAIVTGIAPNGVVTEIADQDVVLVRPAEHNMLAANEAQIILVEAVRVEVWWPLTIDLRQPQPREHRVVKFRVIANLF